MKTWGPLTLALCVTSCSLVVKPAADRCDGDEGCPSGQLCVEEVCVATTPCSGLEICGNGIDDDCDHATDEAEPMQMEDCNGRDDDCDALLDEGFDIDEDGFTSCGVECGDSGCVPVEERVDCNDRAADVHPGAEERCDAIDHDCDGTVVPSETAVRDALCDGGDICEGTLGCIPPDCRAPRPEYGCPLGMLCNAGVSPVRCVDVGCDNETCARLGAQFCDPATGDCTPFKGNGERCGTDRECISTICAPGAALRDTTPGVSYCISPCCSDADCTPDEICWDPGNGARSCLPLDFAALATRRGPGTSPATTACTTDAECRGGACESGQCFGQCRSESDCAAGVCGFIARGGEPRTTACTTQGGGFRSPCTRSSDCAIGGCGFLGGRFVCFDQPCGSDEDCELSGETCTYFRDGRDVYAICVPTGGSRACCHEQHCGDGLKCRPQPVSEFWPMLCTPS